MYPETILSVYIHNFKMGSRGLRRHSVVAALITYTHWAEKEGVEMRLAADVAAGPSTHLPYPGEVPSPLYCI